MTETTVINGARFAEKVAEEYPGATGMDIRHIEPGSEGAYTGIFVKFWHVTIGQARPNWNVAWVCPGFLSARKLGSEWWDDIEFEFDNDVDAVAFKLRWG